jgi:hypothetical protein
LNNVGVAFPSPSAIRAGQGAEWASHNLLPEPAATPHRSASEHEATAPHRARGAVSDPARRGHPEGRSPTTRRSRPTRTPDRVPPGLDRCAATVEGIGPVPWSHVAQPRLPALSAHPGEVGRRDR